MLQLLRQLYIINSNSNRDHLNTSAASGTGPTIEPGCFGVAPETFHSKKITNKLVQQIQDPLILSANAMPDWSQELTFSCPMLFPFDTRLLYFHCTAFGASRYEHAVPATSENKNKFTSNILPFFVSRSIVWLQNQRDQNSERSRSGGLAPRGRDLEIHEFKVGRIKHERVKVPRGDEVLLDWAMQVIIDHGEIGKLNQTLTPGDPFKMMLQNSMTHILSVQLLLKENSYTDNDAGPEALFFAR